MEDPDDVVLLGLSPTAVDERAILDGTPPVTGLPCCQPLDGDDKDENDDSEGTEAVGVAAGIASAAASFASCLPREGTQRS